MVKRNPTKHVEEYTFDEVSKAIEGSISITQVMQKLNITVNNSAYRKIKQIAALHNLSLPVFDNSANGDHRSHPRISNDEYFVNGKLRDGASTKKRLIAHYGFKMECSSEDCDVKETWRGKKISLELDHINGNSFDNRVENLRFLCPNCHSQTSTHSRGAGQRYETCICNRRKPIVENSNPDFCPHVGGIYKQRTCLGCGTEKIHKNATHCSGCEPKRRIASNNTPGNSIYPEIPKIIIEIEEKGYLAYSRELGISDNALRKHLKNRGINPLPRKLTKAEKLKRSEA